MSNTPKFWFQNDNQKTPMQNSLGKIKTAYIMAFISAGATLILVILSVFGQNFVNGLNIFAIVDVIFIIILAVLIMLLKSRVASIILLVYFSISKVILFVDNPATIVSSMFMTLVFLVAYFCGVLGTFSYHKIKKQEQNGSVAEENTEN